MACFEPLPLMRMIYRSLPYITNLDASNRLENNASLDDVFALDHLYRDIFWGCSIVIATVFLMILTCVYCCCTCCVCCVGDCLDRKKPTGVKIGCGLVNTFFVFVGLAVIGASLWAEVMLDRSLQRAVSDTSNSTTSPNTGLSFFINAEGIWHWVIIGYLVILAIFLLVVLLSFITSPLCKNPAAILILLVFLAVFTLMTSVMAGVVLFFLLFLGDTCIAIRNLQHVPGGCLNLDANSFCNDVYFHGFIFCMLGCGLVVTFVLIQIFAPLYASTLTGIEEEEKPKPVVAFQNAGGVWNAYGTQQVLGVTSQAQPVSEDVVLSEVEPPQYNDVVTNMQEV